MTVFVQFWWCFIYYVNYYYSLTIYAIASKTVTGNLIRKRVVSVKVEYHFESSLNWRIVAIFFSLNSGIFFIFVKLIESLGFLPCWLFAITRLSYAPAAEAVVKGCLSICEQKCK